MIVSDTGIGISENHQDQIWLAFRQVSEGLNRTFEGTGLGLTITRKYVESLGGKITLNSKLGAGSTFIIELPVEIVKLHTLEKQNNILLNDNNFKENKMELSKNILYVEDDPYAQEIVTRVLSNTYLINIAENSDKALMKLEENDYDLVLIDINLGMDMDGLKLMNLIRKNPKYFNKPIAAVTAYASTNDKEEFLSKGFSHYISKPFKLQDLRNLIAEIFEPTN
jgi:CheY-like chemotaxis protein